MAEALAKQRRDGPWCCAGAGSLGVHAGMTETCAPVSTRKVNPERVSLMVSKQVKLSGGLEAATSGSPPGCFPANHRGDGSCAWTHQSCCENNTVHFHASCQILRLALEVAGETFSTGSLKGLQQ